jgi:hypothetical protein
VRQLDRLAVGEEFDVDLPGVEKGTVTVDERNDEVSVRVNEPSQTFSSAPLWPMTSIFPVR